MSNEKKFKIALINAINDGRFGGKLYARSFEDAGLLTMNDGIVVYFGRGEPLQMEFCGVWKNEDDDDEWDDEYEWNDDDDEDYDDEDE